VNPSEKSKRPVVFITGASSGIGAAAVPIFAAAGYNVVFSARRKERLDAIASAARTMFPEAQLIPLVCDVNSDAAVSAAFATLRERFGKLDVLINNAGYGVYGSVESTPIEVYRANMETNFFGTVRCTREAIPLLRAAAVANSTKRWGASIVMVSSFVGRRAVPLMAPYCASKFAMEGFSESLRVELHDERIAVSVVNPGVTQTEFVDSAAGTRPGSFLSPEGGMSSEEVAQVLLKAVRRPSRNRYLTSAGKMGILVQWLAPSILDSAMLSSYRKARGT